jgi:serine/threonine protein kinase
MSLCPSEETLGAFLRGALPAGRLAELEGHLDGCWICRTVLSHLKGKAVAPAAAPAPGGKEGRRGWLNDADNAFAAGDLVGQRYRVLRFIGRGGMGEVYEVDDQLLGVRVALKAVTGSAAGTDVRALKGLRREVLMAREVTHPNVCRIFDLGQNGDLGFLTMELLPGATLRQQVLNHPPLTPEEARPIVEPIIQGLAAAHASGVIHRDFKSDNVILVPLPRGGMRPVITDFGLARSPRLDAILSTFTGSLAGTWTHAAPEQLRGQTVSEATDVYALGVVLFELVTGGRLPHESNSPAELATLRLMGPVPSPRRHVPLLDQKWNAAIMRCLEREAAARFPDMHAVAEALYPPEPPAEVRRRTTSSYGIQSSPTPPGPIKGRKT